MNVRRENDDSGARKFSRRAIFGGLLGRKNDSQSEGSSREDPTRVVQLRTVACITFRGTACSICADHCPSPGAIEMQRGRPKILEDLCTGCGDCVPLCPAPVNALQMIERTRTTH